MSVFVDTSAWYAAADGGDTSHTRAVELLSAFTGQLLTSDHVLVETWFLASSRLGYEVAERLVTGIRNGIARIEATGTADLEAAASIGETFADQEFSIVDRTSWAVMQRLGLDEAISFDRDFAIYRFGPQRRRAFVVHR